jgi:hypothetical protein
MSLLLLCIFEHPVLISVLNPNVHTSLWPSALFNRFSKEIVKKNFFELSVSDSIFKSLEMNRLFQQIALAHSTHSVVQLVSKLVSCA